MQPCFITVLQEPVEGLDRQTVEGETHRFPYTQQSIDGTNLGQDVGGIGALLLPLLEPAAFFEQGEHGIEEYLLPFPLDQTRTKVSEKGKIKAGIGEF